MDKKSDIILLMTATIDPKGCPGSKFQVSERIAQYKKALSYYIAKLETKPDNRIGYNKIVFCENSGYDLNELATLVPDEKKSSVEFLSLDSNLFIPAKGKSRNEELIIDLAVDSSRFLLAGDPFFLKVTGRYSIVNILSFTKEIRRHLPELDFYCDVKDHKLSTFKGRNHWCDTRRIGFRVSLYKKHVYGRYEELDYNSGKVIERQIFELSRKLRDVPRTVHRMCREIRIDGLDGQKLYLFNIPIPQKLQRLYVNIRAIISDILRVLIPSFWF